ncbi:MAG: glycosyltransferase family 2 protein [Nitrospinaceae bacterium]|nr:glycosyltransferase family 2 protein [Nitrospinaceae bacterium]MBT3433036.1 glycosyltransferase family 2 protein [Nitrospinaceae bacterium]MBT3821952.1 glycosyltransferase family 2 protein [Nitrospinaceae bacterium]MBT4094542.1 glycosyltransferase family 2 protein [Nitrospinaceae bacterium]MBT4430072.1 glycosyltransferase family 2 protein [Nitrospinaceae bacterium]
MISIVIPALNEAEGIGPFLDALSEQAGVFEIIVSDGGSWDATPQIAADKARLITSPPGRAAQMNQGAAAAKGDILLFLHSDTLLPPGALSLIEKTLIESPTGEPKTVGGGFTHRFDRNDLFSRFISFSANTRSQWTNLLFGDQAIFVRRSVFKKMGGYADMPLFEDWDFSDRMREAGGISILPASVTTSGRRIKVWGKWRCFVIWWGLSILYWMGVPATRLVRFYEHVR